MNVAVILDFRFRGGPGGSVWTRTCYAHNFWRRYLAVFDSVNVVARVEDTKADPEGWRRVDGSGVTVTPVPYYLGPWEYMKKRREVRTVVRSAFRPGDAFIIRAPGQLANVLSPHLARSGYPFGLEVGGDPFEAFGPHGVRHPLRPLLRWWSARALQIQCRRAHAVAYVTEHVLQERYPCARYSIGASDAEISEEALSPGPRVFTTFYSNVELQDEAFVERRAPHPAHSPATLIFVGSLSQMYKGVDDLLRAMALTVSRNANVCAVIVGDGKYRGALENHARALGVAERVRFLGELQHGAAVRAELDKADIFILPSLTEGLSRAMIEAMARGLPCIGTAVGGTVELLPPDDLVPRGQPDMLAAKIESFLRNPAAMAERSKRNLAKAREYRDAILRARRVAFYSYLRGCTEEWRKRQREPQSSFQESFT